MLLYQSRRRSNLTTLSTQSININLHARVDLYLIKRFGVILTNESCKEVSQGQTYHIDA